MLSLKSSKPWLIFISFKLIGLLVIIVAVTCLQDVDSKDTISSWNICIISSDTVGLESGITVGFPLTDIVYLPIML